MKRGIIAISMVVAVSLYAAESQSISEQWEASKEYQIYVRLGGENSSDAKKLESDYEDRLIDKILADFIATYPETYDKNKLKKLFDNLSYSKRYWLADTYTRIKPLLNLSHTPKEYGQINGHIYFFVKSLKEYNGMAVSNLEKLVSVAPEIKNDTKTFQYLLKYAQRYDQASNIDKNISSTITECESMIKKHKEYIQELKKGNYTEAIQDLEQAIAYYEKVISELHADNIDSAKSSYYLAKTEEAIAKSEKDSETWRRITEILKKL